MTPLDEYFAALTDSAESSVGGPLAGTVIAPEADRDGTGSATSSPLSDATVAWCDPASIDLLGDTRGGRRRDDIGAFN